MRGWLATIFLLAGVGCFAQENLGNVNKLKHELARLPADTNRVLRLCDIAYNYRFNKVDSAYSYAAEALVLSEQLNYKTGIAWSNLIIGSTHSIRGRFPQAIAHYEKSIKLADSLHNYRIIGRGLANIAWCVYDLEDYYRAIDYFKRALTYAQKLSNESAFITTLKMNLGQSYLAGKKLFDAEFYLNEVYAQGPDKNTNYAYLLNMFGALRLEQQRYLLADSILTDAWFCCKKLPDKIDKADNRYFFAKLKFAQGRLVEAYQYALEARNYYQQVGSQVDLERTYFLLSLLDTQQGKTERALDYLLISKELRDSVHNSLARYSEFVFDKNEKERVILLQQKNNELLHAEKRNQQTLWQASIFVFGGIILGLGLFTWQKLRTNKKLLVLNNELIEKETDIARQNERLREMNASKDRLFSIIGHDLRSPLLSFKGFTNLLSHQSVNLSKAELKEFLLDLDKSVRNLSTLLENLLNWSLSQTGSIEFKPEVIDIAQSMKENENLLMELANNKRISVVNECPTPLPVYVHPQSINTVIRNLISNAIKFTQEGGVIRLRAHQINGHVRVSITDTGLGISEEAKLKLFKIGTKHSTLGTAFEKGSGLGLILCKEFVEKNGGIIGFDSIVGKGSDFFFTIPAAHHAVGAQKIKVENLADHRPR
ncbi:MAG TPA: tetratricopeptide repeat-containing sensor histidine kinase [Cyclobacteriaceae bacterium]|jgi:signal transduction histidine kinase|nr:tetratricopeptide repeat-containing sensor histidine kinase [Cyclobacteriaceae bacterium]